MSTRIQLPYATVYPALNFATAAAQYQYHYGLVPILTVAKFSVLFKGMDKDKKR